MDLDKIIEAARAQGFTVTRTARGHWRFVPPTPTGRICIHPGTSSDQRGIHNLVSCLRRQGFIWPPRR
jgi:hypothetical protein